VLVPDHFPSYFLLPFLQFLNPSYFGRLIPAPDFSWKFYSGTILAAATLGRTDFLGFLQIFCFLGMVDGC
jgi:hypothetical protein